MKRNTFVSIVLLASSFSFVTAQSINVNGKVEDKQSNPISGVKVTLVGTSMIVYTDASGEFSINNVGIEDKKAIPNVYFNGEAVIFTSSGTNTVISVYDIYGRVISHLSTSLTQGSYKFYPTAYIPDPRIGIYIVNVRMGNEEYSLKIINSNPGTYEPGIISAATEKWKSDFQPLKLKATSDLHSQLEVDKLLLEHSAYEPQEILLDSYTENVGIVTMNDLIVAPEAPSNLSVEARDPKSIRLRWTDNSDNETEFEIWRETIEGSGIYDIVGTAVPNATSYLDTELNSTSFGYKVRARNLHLGSEWSESAFAPAMIRIINDLDNQTDAYNNDWEQLNNIVRVRVGKTQNDVLNNTALERLEPKESSGSYEVNYIQPIYTGTPSFSNYEDFPVSTYGYGADYHIFLQCGWWEYDAAVTFSWIKRVTNVLCNDGNCCCLKWRVIIVTDHRAGYNVINASDFLPLRHWNGL